MKTIHTIAVLFLLCVAAKAQTTFYVVHNMPDVLPVRLYMDNQAVGDRLGYLQQTHFDYTGQADSIYLRAESITGQLVLEHVFPTPQDSFLYVVLDGNTPNIRMLAPDTGGYVFYSTVNDTALSMSVNDTPVPITQDSFSKIPLLTGQDSIIFTDKEGRQFSEYWQSSFYTFEHFLMLTNTDIFLPKGFQFFGYLPDGTSIKMGNRQKLVFASPSVPESGPSIQFYNNATEEITVQYNDTTVNLMAFEATPMLSVATDTLQVSFIIDAERIDTSLALESTDKRIIIVQEDQFNEQFLLSGVDVSQVQPQEGLVKTFFYHGVQDGSPFDFSVNQEVVSQAIFFSNFSDLIEIPTSAFVVGIRPTGFLEDLLPYPNNFSDLENAVSVLVAGGFLGADPLLQLNFVMPDGTVLNVQEAIEWTAPTPPLDTDTTMLSFSLVNFLGSNVDLYWQDSLIGQRISQDIQVPAICIGGRTGNLSIAGLTDSLQHIELHLENAMNTLLLQQLNDTASATILPALESQPNVATFALYNLSAGILRNNNMEAPFELAPEEFTTLKFDKPVQLTFETAGQNLAYQIDLNFWKGRTGYLVFSFQDRPRLLAVLEDGGTFEIFPQP